jgi:predicted DsbA family dithiol-disulfide isomerase
MKLESVMAPEDHIVMTQKLQIDFVSDVACPWCAIGLYGLEEALRRTADLVEVDLRFQPFELNPGMTPDGQNLDEHIGEKYGSSPKQLADGREMLRARAAGVGFAFNSSSDSRVYNTFDAHRLLHWARDKGSQRELKRALFQANFTDDENVSSPEVLITAATKVGLDPTEAREVLESGRFTKEVLAAQQLWTSRGIHAVPGVIINGKWLISGGQPPEIFEQALRNIAMEIASGSETA